MISHVIRLLLPGILSFTFVQQSSEPPQGLLLVSNNAERQVELIDVEAKKVLASFPSLSGPHEITISRDGKFAFVADTGVGGGDGDSVVVLNLKARRLHKSFTTCERPHDTRLSRDGRILWVACAPAKAIIEMDAATGATRKTWNIKLDGGWFVEVTPDDRKLYVPHLEGKAVTVVDRRTGEIKSILSGTTQFALAVSPDGREVWVADADENQLSIVDTSTDSVIATVELGGMHQGGQVFSRLRFTPNGSQVVVVGGSKFTVIDAARRLILWSINMEHDGKVVTVSGDNRHAFVSHPDADRVSMINLLTRRTEVTFNVGKQPDGLAWFKNPDFE